MTSRETIVLDETIHQSTRLRIMALVVSVPEGDRLAYGFIQNTLGLTGGNLTTHLRKLEGAGYLTMEKEFVDAKPRTWGLGNLCGTVCLRRLPGQSGEGAQAVVGVTTLHLLEYTSRTA